MSKCVFKDCKTRSHYNYKNEKKALYCSKHKLPNMINIKGKTCLSKWCSTRVINKYEGYCQYCYFNLFPDKPITRNYKTKEKAVADFIKEQFPNIDIQTDKKIIDGCSRRRPDVFIDVGFQVIIVEIDENQHISYDCSCENKRIMELSQDVQHRPIVFIRFNPDDYEINGIKNKSCWNINKNTGICFIKKSKVNEWNNRLKQLKETISYWMDINNCTDKIIEVIQLYYDE